ncbi:lysozyme [Paraherbaspirillum soli]|uniref:Lysozyme n=1 Tax=Paraherbaspirillum soli TaxID=631222 RepID=A0ABW0M6A8_9BURK
MTISNPNSHMRMSSAGRVHLRNTEALRTKYYNDGGRNKGNCTYGYGTLIQPRRLCTVSELRTTVPMSMIEHSLERKLTEFERAIHRNVTYPLNQAQFDALVSYTYNRGAGGAARTYEFINNGDFQGAIDEMNSRIYSTQGGKSVLMPGLVIRRQAETAPFRMP